MKKYKDLSGNSGITGYDIAPGAITVRFQDGWKYLYTEQSTGPENIATMQRLATAGKGLATFISQQVGKDYLRRWR